MRDEEKHRAAWKRWYERNHAKVRAKARARYRLNRERELERMARWREENRDKMRTLWRRHDAKPERKARKAELERTEKRKAGRRAYQKKNPRTEYHRLYETLYKKRRKELHAHKQDSDPQYRIRRSLRASLKNAIKKNCKGGSAISNLGCSISELKLHLEQYWLPNMSWDNFGRLDALHQSWQIDHIVPLSSFDLTDPKQVSVACHYTNLAPLWAIDNRRKGNKTIGRLEVSYAT
jgi:hypothetical protein